MAYHALSYFALFIPVLMLVYSLVPSGFRWMVLLCADYVFFWIWSGWLLLYNVAASLFTWIIGMKLESMKKIPKDVDKKQFKKKRKRILVTGILCNLLVLIALKYTNFLGENIWNLAGSEWKKLNILVPIGISYYTLQEISYLSDISSGKITAEKNPAKLALYLSFFPILVEGPISRYSEISDDLYAGKDISYENLTSGYRRILWGLFKKMTIADYLAIATDVLFTKHTGTGSLCLTAAVFYTIQLYADFSGTIDVVIGSAKIFGVILPENFRQPFFAKDAGEFWRRWHITLGAFLRDYVFYPVSLSKPVMKLSKQVKKKFGAKPAKMIGPLIALAVVWLCNGFWHGPYWTYILYGIYYLIILGTEMIIKEPSQKLYAKLHISESNKGLRVFRFVKLMIIIIFGEMLFRADSAVIAREMFTSIFMNFRFDLWKQEILMLGLGRIDYMIIAFSFMIVIIADILKEKNISLISRIEKMPAPARWALWYACILYVVFLGAYGPGYTAEAMMYAGF